MRRIFPILVLLLATPLLFEPVLRAGAFSDTGKSPYDAAIEALKEKGVIEGYGDGTFKPLNGINRAEFLKIVLEARGDEDFSGADCFPDVTDQWFAKYVCTGKEEGIVSGYPDGTFKPEQEINFAESSKMIALAFDQQMQMNSPDWYEPYVRALESSKAIPTTVARMESTITRGEMSEMIWRLTDEVTDQPSKSYMNVKYPEVKIDLSSDAPQRAKSCADLQAFANEAQRSGGGWGMGGGDMMLMRSTGVMAAEEAAPAPMAGQANEAVMKSMDGGAADYSQTNVQVQGVDEADVVKTDGTYLYIVSQQRVRIVRANPANDMGLVSTIDLSSEGFTPSDLYIDGERLTIVGSRYREYAAQPVGVLEKRMAAPSFMPPYPWWRSSLAEVRIFNVTDRSAPKQIRRVSFEGSQVSSRRIGDQLYLVVNQGAPWVYPMPVLREGAAVQRDAESTLPSFEDTASGKGEQDIARCSDVVILPRIPSPQYLTVAAITLDDMDAEVDREVILGNAENVYMSLDNLYIASTEWRYSWRPMPLRAAINGDLAPLPDDEDAGERTNVYRFAVDGNGLTMEAQGTVPGRILNQFSMDEHGGSFRIATTKGEIWDSSHPSTNNLFILKIADMKQTGSLTDIAPGEKIYSTRFLGNRVYMVTFKNIDPFFVIDASDPANPKILGKLKIPGYSDYLHPYDENHIIGFGKEAVDSKDQAGFAWYQGMKVAIFDVTDVADPKELHKVVIGDRGTDSPLLHDHKALLFDRARNLLAFPVTISEIPASQKQGNEPSAYGSPVFQGAIVFEFTLKDGFRELGKISHYDEDTYMKSGDYWVNYGRDIQRILRIDSSLLTVSDGAVQSHSFPGIAQEGEVTFENDSPYGGDPGMPIDVAPPVPMPFFEDTK